MRVINISAEAVDKIKDLPDTTPSNDRMHKYQKAYEEIKTSLDTPVYLAVATKVSYDQKTDRYVVTFGGREKVMILKATNDVTELVASHIHDGGSWYGRLENGVLVDVNLIQV
jgi:hypothetical protein